MCSVFVEKNEKKICVCTNVFGGFMFGSLVRFYFLLCIIISPHFAAECVYFACDDEFARFSFVPVCVCVGETKNGKNCWIMMRPGIRNELISGLCKYTSIFFLFESE